MERTGDGCGDALQRISTPVQLLEIALTPEASSLLIMIMTSQSATKLLRPADVVYGHVKRRIMLNDLKPETVLTELGLAHEIGCSQGTIREALLRLQEDGLVSRTARRGTIVTRLTADEAQEMLVLRRTIETRGAPRAAKACTNDLLTTLERIRAAMDEAAADQDEYRLIEADKDFHLAIFRASGLDALEQILVRCIMHSHRCKLWAPGHRRSLVDTATRHDVLLDRLRAHDGEGLAQALGEHIDTLVLLSDPVAGASGGHPPNPAEIAA